MVIHTEGPLSAVGDRREHPQTQLTCHLFSSLLCPPLVYKLIGDTVSFSPQRLPTRFGSINICSTNKLPKCAPNFSPIKVTCPLPLGDRWSDNPMKERISGCTCYAIKSLPGFWLQFSQLSNANNICPTYLTKTPGHPLIALHKCGQILPRFCW